MALSPDEQQVLARLDEWAAQVDACMAYGTKGRPLSRAETGDARQRYRTLKAGLRAEAGAMDTVRGEARLTDAEARWYHHTICEAAAHLSAPVTAPPGPGAWLDALYWAHGDLASTIHALRTYAQGR